MVHPLGMAGIVQMENGVGFERFARDLEQAWQFSKETGAAGARASQINSLMHRWGLKSSSSFQLSMRDRRVSAINTKKVFTSA
jgi:hypothetical protein